MKHLTVTIVGLGLIGGSAAKALHGQVGRLYGVDTDPAVLAAAQQDGAIDQGFSSGADVLPQTDLTILAVYPAAAQAFIKDNYAHFKQGSLLTDLVGIKTPLMALYTSLEQPPFTYIGGHPMAGKEVSGYANAEKGLFQNANFLLVPPANAQEEQIQLIETLARCLGCGTITRTTAQAHDQIIAYTSQLPHVIATAMCDTPLLVEHRHFTGGSFEDVTRVAKINEKLWSELFIENGENLVREIDSFTETVLSIKDAIVRKDKPALEEIMRRVRLAKEMVDNA